MAKNIFSEYLALPKDSRHHKQLREELWLGGHFHACRYYLSIILDRDFFAVSDDDFLRAVREYLISETCADVVQFLDVHHHPQFVMPFLKQQCEIAEGDGGHRHIGKEEQALILLLKHPAWSDEQIRTAVRTTEKQMRRWSTYNAARGAQKQYKNKNGVSG